LKQSTALFVQLSQIAFNVLSKGLKSNVCSMFLEIAFVLFYTGSTCKLVKKKKATINKKTLFPEHVDHELPSQLQQHGDLVQRQQVQV
jgi:hypothetical protein